MIINVAHTKGGVGKTTIAVNIALTAGAPILDLDLQASSVRFSQIRPAELQPLETVTLADGQFNQAMIDYMNQYSEHPTRHLVIDSGGMDNDIIREGLLYSDIIITPVGISQIEFFGLQDFDDLLQGIDRQNTYVLLNNVNKQAKKNIKVARELIEADFNFQLLDTMLGHRVAYKEAYGEGKSVVEAFSDSAAAKEIQDLVKELKL